jgi:choline-glycine betaine transporter
MKNWVYLIWGVVVFLIGAVLVFDANLHLLHTGVVGVAIGGGDVGWAIRGWQKS